MVVSARGGRGGGRRRGSDSESGSGRGDEGGGGDDGGVRVVDELGDGETAALGGWRWRGGRRDVRGRRRHVDDDDVGGGERGRSRGRYRSVKKEKDYNKQEETGWDGVRRERGREARDERREMRDERQRRTGTKKQMILDKQEGGEGCSGWSGAVWRKQKGRDNTALRLGHFKYYSTTSCY